MLFFGLELIPIFIFLLLLAVFYIIGFVIYAIIIEEIRNFAKRKAFTIAYQVLEAKNIEVDEDTKILTKIIVDKIIDENEKQVFDYSTGEPGQLP